MKITEDILYVGVNDKKIDLFEGQYRVPNGISYNSYLIKDEKNVILDTVDKSFTKEWLENIEKALQGEKPDFLVISHMEPDHSASIQALADRYPQMKLIGNQKTFAFLPQFFEIDHLEERKVKVKDGETVNFGKHTLKFVMAPMVHWPEVMMEYEETEKILFSADAFGTFGVMDEMQPIKDATKEERWLEEARRYYVNIVGKYGIQVQATLKKLANIEVKTICPLHGPILTENLEYYLQKYKIWSQYEAEKNGIMIACGSMHGYTWKAMCELEKMLKEKTKKEVMLMDLAKTDITEAVSQAFCYETLVLAAPTYNADLFPAMDDFLRLLKGKGYQNRKVALVENGTWAPMTAKLMEDRMTQMKNIEIIHPFVTIRTKLNQDSKQQLESLVDELIK